MERKQDREGKTGQKEGRTKKKGKKLKEVRNE